MILQKYERIFKNFMVMYEKIHISPWHAITKNKLLEINNKLLSEMSINDEYSFNYYCNYIIKRLNGSDDAHTKYLKRINETTILPFNFKIIENSVYVTYPKNLYGAELVSINNVEIKKIIQELDEIITYGTLERKRSEIEQKLFNRLFLFGLPSLRKYSKLKMQFIHNGELEEYNYQKDDKISFDDCFDINEYDYENNCKYYFKDDCLIYIHKSVQNIFKDKIETSVNEIKQLDLSKIEKIIIDLRGNFGGNSKLNIPILEFLQEHKDKKIFVITDYKVFSSGRLMLNSLIKLGATTIGEEIGTPMNCFGEIEKLKIEDYNFNISKKYFNPIYEVYIDTKEDFIKNGSLEITKPIYYHPNFLIKYSKEDLFENRDPYIDYIVNKKIKN